LLFLRMLCVSYTFIIIAINSNPTINKASASSSWYLVTTLSNNYSIQRIMNRINLLKECFCWHIGGAISPQLVPYDLLTDKEKRKDRERSQEFLKYLQYQGYKLHR